MARSDPPQPDGRIGLLALRRMIAERSILTGLEVLHREMGDVFRLSLPGFRPIVLVGPQANRFVLVTAKPNLRWRVEGDPVTKLLRHGLLVEDDRVHDQLRRTMNPALHKQMLAGYVESMWHNTDQIGNDWADGETVDMLVEMRRVSLLVLLDTLFGVDFSPDMERLWPALLKTLRYISPGPWLLWRGIPRPGYRQALRQIDSYLYRIIADRRARDTAGDDLLNLLIDAGMNDHLIRDQLLTMLIAGHDTSTALLAWALWLLGNHPHALRQARTEVDAIMGRCSPTLTKINELQYLTRVIDETLRLYPPIHAGNRVAATDLEFQGYRITAGTRILYSIYLTHRHPDHWCHPTTFDPDRFLPDRHRSRAHYAFLPFGGGRRNCIGMAFAQVQAAVVLARLLQRFDLELVQKQVHVHMGATLEPRPGVRMKTRRRFP